MKNAFFPYAESQMKQMKLTGTNFPTKTAVILESLQLLSLRGYKNWNHLFGSEIRNLYLAEQTCTD